MFINVPPEALYNRHFLIDLEELLNVVCEFLKAGVLLLNCREVSF